MCADYTPGRKEAISEHFGVESMIFDFLTETFPAYMAPIIRPARATEGGIECVPACFGMVPHWADMKLARQTYNARTETVADKPSFRNAWRKRQFCIVPAVNFFEPNYESGKPVRWRISHVAERPMGIAGIWEWKPNGPDGQPLISFSMLTVNADQHPLMQRFHKPDEEKRMVLILEPEQYHPWLEGLLTAPEDIFRMLPAEQLVAVADPMPKRTKAAPKTAATTAETAPEPDNEGDQPSLFR